MQNIKLQKHSSTTGLIQLLPADVKTCSQVWRFIRYSRPCEYQLLSVPTMYCTTAATVLRSLCHVCVRMFVGVYYVSTIKRKPLIGMNWNFARRWSSTLCRSLLVWMEKVKRQGHRHKISNMGNPLNIFVTVKDRHFVFDIHKSTTASHRMTSYPLNWAWSWSRDRYVKLRTPSVTLEWMKLRTPVFFYINRLYPALCPRMKNLP